MHYLAKRKHWIYFEKGTLIMIEVYKNLCVGNQEDYESYPAYFKDWFVVHACKEPYHRSLLKYTTRGAPKDSPFYYYGFDSFNNLVMNIVDANDASFFNEGMIKFAVKCCLDNLSRNKKVLIHCNQGESRAPSLAMLVLKEMGSLPTLFDEAVGAFKKVYPSYNPGIGIYNYLKGVWENEN